MFINREEAVAAFRQAFESKTVDQYHIEDFQVGPKTAEVLNQELIDFTAGKLTKLLWADLFSDLIGRFKTKIKNIPGKVRKKLFPPDSI